MSVSGTNWVCNTCTKNLYVKCPNCNKDFKKRSPAFNKKGTGCCSKKCGYEFNKIRHTHICVFCKKDFENNINYKTSNKHNRSKFCSVKCHSDYKKKNPKKFCCNVCGKDFYRKYLDSYKVCSQKCNGKSHSKEKSHWWKGGITPKNKAIRNSTKYSKWRTAVFKRDNYTCVLCNKRGNGILNADHIKKFADYPKLRFSIRNGRTLCKPCHKSTDTYGNRKRPTFQVSRQIKDRQGIR